MNGIEYSQDPSNFYVRYNAAKRDYADMRTEFNNDATTIKNTHDSSYVLFSTGVDSQIITRCFIDCDVNAEYIFLNSVGYSNPELQRIKECEKFYGIKIRVIDIDINSFKDQWIDRNRNEFPISMYHYPFEYLSSILEKDYPIITQGANDPALIGSNYKNMSVYCNYYEGMQQRFRLMSKYRPVLDFPFSPEAISSYYTDANVKSFVNTIQYYIETDLEKHKKPLAKSQYWNTFGKPMTKARHFKDDVIWYGKLHGYEDYPSWVGYPKYLIKETRVTVPYWDLVDFLENNRFSHKDYNEWIYNEDTPGFISLDM